MATLNPALRDFWRTRGRYHVLYGGRASSKSWDAAGMLVYLSSTYRIRVVACRQFLNKSGESIYALLKGQIYRFGLQSEFDVQTTRIICKTTGSEIFFLGLWRNIDEIRSLEDIDICLLEEAHNLTNEQLEVLDPTFRKKGFMFIIIFNPNLITDFVYKYFVIDPPASAVVRKINYLENPYLEKTFIDELIEPLRLSDEDEYNHIYLGYPRSDDDQSIIKRSHVMASIDAHKKLGIDIRGAKTIGFDVGDTGDPCAMIYGHGPLAYQAELWKAKEDELLKSCTRVWNAARDTESTVIYDAIGVGAFVGSKFNEISEKGNFNLSHKKFFAGGKVEKPDSKYKNTGILNKDFFSNIKAQKWWIVGDKFSNTYNAVMNGEKFDDDEMIFIDSSMENIDKLIDELCIVKRDFDDAGRVKAESKKDLAKRDINSPNLADAFIMRACGQRTSWDNYR